MPALRPALLFVLCALAMACSEPPTREMDLARGAIDAARAAGAETYAADEYKAAVTALERAEEAVGQRDHRLALNYALDSRERAQNAAKLAADGRANARSEAEGLLADVTSAMAVAIVRLQSLEAGRAPKAALAPLQKAIADAQAAVTDAGKALATQDYLAAAARLRGVAETVRAAEAAVAEATAASPARAPRKRR